MVSAGFTLEHCGGVVVFEAPLELDDEVTVSGKYLTVVQHGGFFNWSAELELETSDITTFQSAGWKETWRQSKGLQLAQRDIGAMRSFLQGWVKRWSLPCIPMRELPSSGMRALASFPQTVSRQQWMTS